LWGLALTVLGMLKRLMNQPYERLELLLKVVLWIVAIAGTVLMQLYFPSR
jgi:hypothetical protein